MSTTGGVTFVKRDAREALFESEDPVRCFFRWDIVQHYNVGKQTTEIKQEDKQESGKIDKSETLVAAGVARSNKQHVSSHAEAVPTTHLVAYR
jgi:hypothetical protein